MKIVIYSKPNCNWCVKSKELMNKLHMSFEEKILDVDYTRNELREMVYGDLAMSMTPTLTVPQIYVDGHRIGGYEDFAEWCDNHGLTDE